MQTDHVRLDEIARRHGVVLMLVFGSAESGRQHPRSDLDIAVLLERPSPSFHELADLTHDVQTLFPREKLDLALINTADPLFLKQITDRCRLLYGNPRRLLELKLYAYKRYQDHRRYLALEREYVSRALQAPADQC